MEFPSLDTLLLPTEIRSTTYNKLICLLNENESWRRVAEAFGIFSDYDLRVLQQQRLPAQQLLSELGTRLCTVGTLCEVLRECELYSVLMLFKNHEPLQIVEQSYGDGDNLLMVLRGKPLRLVCKATGLPPPTYQWFHGNGELRGETNSTLNIPEFGLQNEGEYYCLIDQDGYETLSSNTVTVLLAPERPTILKQPTPREVCPLNSKVTLSVHARGHPKVRYQWFKGNEQLDGCTEPHLILYVKKENQDGRYRCYIHNKAGEVWSEECHLTVYMSPRPEPSAKLALLIANQLYDNLSPLYTPENDVKTLADLLRELGFHVVALQNLNLTEMRNAIQTFSKILPKEAYVVFYFAGHGFEIRDKFMLPVDAPGPEDYLQTNAICEREVLRNVLASRPKLLLQLLDMCLKPPDPSNKRIYQETVALVEYEANNNLIQGYATTSYLSAYETKSDSNGLYVENLKQYLNKEQDLPIVKILENVAKDIACVCPKQKPYFGTNVTKDYRLNDYCNENPSVQLKMEALSEVPRDFVLNFKQVDIDSRTSFSPHLGVFLNTLRVRFTNLQNFLVSCEAEGEELKFDLIRLGEYVILNVKNLQKLVCAKTLTLSLRKKNGELVDCAVWDIGKPMIAVADLWWENENCEERRVHDVSSDDLS